MTKCPYCDFQIIEGDDSCEQCGQPLDDLHLAIPPTEMERSLLRDRISSLDPKTPVVVLRESTVREVLKTLVNNAIGCVFVTDGKELVGVFSERDALLRLNEQSAEHMDRPIADFMTADPQSLLPTAKVAFAVRQMDLGGYRHIPVVQDGEATGVVSVRDILRFLSYRIAATN